MSKHIPFPKIEQFLNVIRSVTGRAEYSGKDANGKAIYDANREKPVLKFKGTIKLHGTNAGIVYSRGKGIYQAQGRNNILSLEKDNMGFCAYAMRIKDKLMPILDSMVSDDEILVVFGEFCGSNIQKNVALTQLEKRFVVFDVVKYNDETNRQHYFDDLIDKFNYPELDLYNVHLFENYSMDIDFNNPKLVQNQLIEITNKVEAHCPAGLYFGVDGIGEGVVWSWVDPDDNTVKLRFKVKGEKHSETKVKKLVEVDMEKVANAREFAIATATEVRIKNMMNRNQLEVSLENIRHLQTAVLNDIFSEEMLRLTESGLQQKDVIKPINTIVALWMKSQVQGIEFDANSV